MPAFRRVSESQHLQEDSMSSHASPLAMGLGTIFGEMVFGLNGPFLFGRFGLGDPLAVAAGVVFGAAVGLGLAVMAPLLLHRQPAPAEPAHQIPADAQLHTN
jgi:hypothetical protein